MRPFDFSYAREGHLATARWLYPMDMDIAWDVPARYPTDEPGEVELFGQHGMRIQEEFAARFLAWRLTAHHARVATQHYHRDAAIKLLGRTDPAPDRVRWEYDFEVFDSDCEERDRGFVRARSDTAPEGSTADDLEGGEGALLRVEHLADLHRMSAAGLGDSDKGQSLVGLVDTPARYAEFVTMLRRPERPQLEHLIRGDEVFVHLAEGHDLGGYHVVLVKSHAALQHRVETAAAETLAALASYGAATQAFKTVEEWSVALDRLNQLAD